jgi:hypothetical protein
MTELNIVTWNPITDTYGNVVASFYIKPTIALLDFLNRQYDNGNRPLVVIVDGTNHPIYDNMPFLATVDASSDVPNLRQNFYQSTGLYVVTLAVSWHGYPPQQGRVTFKEGILDGKPSSLTDVQPNINVSNEDDAKNNDKKEKNESKSDMSNKGDNNNDKKIKEDIKKSDKSDKSDKVVENFKAQSRGKFDKNLVVLILLGICLILLMLILVGCCNGSGDGGNAGISAITQ